MLVLNVKKCHKTPTNFKQNWGVMHEIYDPPPTVNHQGVLTHPPLIVHQFASK